VHPWSPGGTSEPAKLLALGTRQTVLAAAFVEVCRFGVACAVGSRSLITPRWLTCTHQLDHLPPELRRIRLAASRQRELLPFKAGIDVPETGQLQPRDSRL